MNACTVLQALLTMFNSHMDVPANQAKIQQIIQYQQDQCALHEKKQKKESKDKKEEKEK